MVTKNTTQRLRGFAAMDPEKQRQIARKGGKAPHRIRGFQALDDEQVREIASKGGSAPHEQRGFQAMSSDQQRTIASQGGHASHGGGRPAIMRSGNQEAKQIMRPDKQHQNTHKGSKIQSHKTSNEDQR